MDSIIRTVFAAVLLFGQPVVQQYESDPSKRILELLKTSEDLRQVEEEWERVWFTDQPSHLTPANVPPPCHLADEATPKPVAVRDAIDNIKALDRAAADLEKAAALMRKGESARAAKLIARVRADVAGSAVARKAGELGGEEAAEPEPSADFAAWAAPLTRAAVKVLAAPRCTASQAIAWAEREQANRAQVEAMKVQLSRPVTAKFTDVPLKNVIAEMRDVYGVRIEIDVDSMKRAGLDVCRPVTARVENMPMLGLLQMIGSNTGVHPVVECDRVRLTADRCTTVSAPPCCEHLGCYAAPATQAKKTDGKQYGVEVRTQVTMRPKLPAVDPATAKAMDKVLTRKDEKPVAAAAPAGPTKQLELGFGANSAGELTIHFKVNKIRTPAAGEEEQSVSEATTCDWVKKAVVGMFTPEPLVTKDVGCLSLNVGRGGISSGRFQMPVEKGTLVVLVRNGMPLVTVVPTK